MSPQAALVLGMWILVAAHAVRGDGVGTLVFGAFAIFVCYHMGLFPTFPH